jgi:Protein of unknown function (DUF2924)
MAQSFGRDDSRPFTALATPEGSGLSASGGCARRPRQGDCAFYSRFARRCDDFAGSPFKKRRPRTRDGIGLNPGALLVREWKGKLERVMVLDKGFAWNGRTFGSLSQVAKAITGTSWNGHRFFGLRSAKEQSSRGRVARPSAYEDRRCETDESKNLGRGESKGIGRRQTKRPRAKGKHPAALLSGRRGNNSPQPEPLVLVEGEPRRDSVEVCP